MLQGSEAADSTASRADAGFYEHSGRSYDVTGAASASHALFLTIAAIVVLLVLADILKHAHLSAGVGQGQRGAPVW